MALRQSELSVGAFLDIFSNTAGVIEFGTAETFDFDLLVGGQPSGLTRLNAEGIGTFDPEADLNSYEEVAGFTVTGQGIVNANNGSGVFTDAGFNMDNQAFLWGQLDFTVVGEGSTDISAVAGDGMIVNGDSVVDAAFTTATINVGATIPEPTTAGLLACGLVGLVARRRR